MDEVDDPNIKPFRVLSIDGGGMRGIYAATYLHSLSGGIRKRRQLNQELDIGKAFDLIVGTSTGGILACALASGISMDLVVGMYRSRGRDVFSLPLPSSRMPWFLKECVADHLRRPRALKAGNDALRAGLVEIFGKTTIKEVYQNRGIALAIPAIEMSSARSWVFKTPHLESSMGRDDDYRLVDVCLATSAAPIYRSLAIIERPGQTSAKSTSCFADGGLWANNPVLVGLIEALSMSGPEQAIEIFSLGTCPKPGGCQVRPGSEHRGLVDWKFGAEAASLSISAQEVAYDNMARLIADNLRKDCYTARLPQRPVSQDLLSYLGMDDTREEAIEALVEQAHLDADEANVWCQNDTSGRRFEAALVCAVEECVA